MAAYHCIAIALGQSGLLKELVNVIDCMKQEPSNIIKKTRHKNWDPVLLPDLVVYNAVRDFTRGSLFIIAIRIVYTFLGRC